MVLVADRHDRQDAVAIDHLLEDQREARLEEGETERHADDVGAGIDSPGDAFEQHRQVAGAAIDDVGDVQVGARRQAVARASLRRGRMRALGVVDRA